MQVSLPLLTLEGSQTNAGNAIEALAQATQGRDSLNLLSLLSLFKRALLSFYRRLGACTGWKLALLVMGTVLYSPGAREWGGLSCTPAWSSSHPLSPDECV